MTDRPEITPLLDRAARGDRQAFDAVARLVQDDLARVARRLLVRRHGARAASVTLDPEALVNETFVKLLQQRRAWANREHFFAVATRIMLRVVADYDRSRRRRKRDATRVFISLRGLAGEGAAATVEPARVTALLDELEALDPRAARVARLRLLWGMEHDEMGRMLGISRSTVDRDWRFARAWLADRV